jgi:hypothetical protein
MLHSDMEVLQFLESTVIEIEVFNHKTGEKGIYKFSNQYNNQYLGEDQGRKLIKIVVERLLNGQKKIN